MSLFMEKDPKRMERDTVGELSFDGQAVRGVEGVKISTRNSMQRGGWWVGGLVANSQPRVLRFRLFFEAR
jgi:hypothetical protein